MAAHTSDQWRGFKLNKGEREKQNPDRELWDMVKNRVTSGKGERPSAEVLAQFLDGTRDEAIQEKVYDWLANDEEAIDELRLLRESVRPIEEIDGQLLEQVKSRVQGLVSSMETEVSNESWWTNCATAVHDFFTFRGWAATAAAGCVLLGFSLLAFRLGTSTFIDRLQAREILTRELTFGLSDALTMREAAPLFVTQDKGE